MTDSKVLPGSVTALDNTPRQKPPPAPADWRKALFDAIKHGDEEHQAWLKEALDAFFDERPVPPPRGVKKSRSAREEEVLQLAYKLKKDHAGPNRMLDMADVDALEGAVLALPNEPEAAPILRVGLTDGPLRNEPVPFRWTKKDLDRLTAALQAHCEKMAKTGAVAETLRTAHAANAVLALAEKALREQEPETVKTVT